MRNTHVHSEWLYHSLPAEDPNQAESADCSLAGDMEEPDEGEEDEDDDAGFEQEDRVSRAAKFTLLYLPFLCLQYIKYMQSASYHTPFIA